VPVRESNGAPPSSGGTTLRNEERFLRFKKDLHERLIKSIDLAAIGRMSDEELRIEIRRAAEEQCRLSPDLISLSDRERLVNEVLDETFGLGPLEPLLRDPHVTDILVNGAKTVYVERTGGWSGPVVFNDEKHLLQIVQRIVGGSAGGWTRPARWWTPGCPTAAASTRSSRRWP
jgi:pilus assembly protein CpaF